MIKADNSNSANSGLFYFGNAHETVPLRLLQDPYLTVRAKYTWQMIRYHAKAFAGSLFPSYEKLQTLISDKLYSHEKVSRKIVSQTLLLLRLTRWLTLCDKKRDKFGRILGNIYIIHDEPISITDTLHFDTNYLQLLLQSTQHKDKIVRDVAQHIVDALQSDDATAHFVSQFHLMQKRFNEYQQTPLKRERDTKQAQQIMQQLLSDENASNSNRELSKELSKNEENLPSSNRELSKNEENLPSSNRELSKNEENLVNFHTELSEINLVPSQYSTSTKYIYNKYSTSTALNFYDLVLTPVERNTIVQLARQLKLTDELTQQIIDDVKNRSQHQYIQKPLNYICSLLHKAHNGTFNQQLTKFKTQMAKEQANAVVQPPEKNSVKQPLTVKRSPEELASIVHFAKTLAAELNAIN